MRDRHPRPAAALGVVLALALAGCGEESGPDPGTSLTVTATDEQRFDPDELRVPEGEEITVVLTAGAGQPHDFIIEDGADHGMLEDAGVDDADQEHRDGIDRDDLHVAHAVAGGSAEGVFTLHEPGSYVVYCAMPGHRDRGMEASLEVVAED